MPEPQPNPFGERIRALLHAVEDALPLCTRCNGLGFIAEDPRDEACDVPCDEAGCPFVPLMEARWLADRAGEALATLAGWARDRRANVGRLRAALAAADELLGTEGGPPAREGVSDG